MCFLHPQKRLSSCHTACCNTVKPANRSQTGHSLSASHPALNWFNVRTCPTLLGTTTLVGPATEEERKGIANAAM